MPDLHNIRLPAGWYPDPAGADHRRWWDGKTWTQHTAPFQRPVPVYDVVDKVEPRQGRGTTAEDAPRPPDAVPAPRRIRTAARLGRGLAALAHKLPFGLPAPADAEDVDGVDSPPPTTPSVPEPAVAPSTPSRTRARAEPVAKAKAKSNAQSGRHAR